MGIEWTPKICMSDRLKSVLCQQIHTQWRQELEDRPGLRSGCGGMYQVHVGHLSLGIARPRGVILGYALITLFTLK